MKKLLIIIPIVIVIAAATVLGLFAAGVIGKKDEPVAYAVDSEATETGIFKDLGVDTFFDILADRDPSTALDNFVIIHDSKGNKVPLKSERQGDGVYRITARDGFKARATYRIWATGASFVAAQYKDLDSFIFTIKGDKTVENVTKQDGIKETDLEGTTVKALDVSGNTYYTVTLGAVASERYQKGDVILAKKPVDGGFDADLEVLYAGDIPGYEYNGMAAYVVERESEIVDGKEEIYCRLAGVSDVVKKIDIYKTLTIDEGNFTVNEQMLQEALDKSEFTAAVYEAAVEAFDLLSGKFEKTVKDSPKMVAKFEYNVDKEKIQLDFYFIITLAKGVDVTFAVKNTINLTPNLNWEFDGDLDDLELDLGVNIKTKTVASIEMETADAKLQATDIEDFKKKFTDLVTGKTAEKGIVGAELPIYSYKYPIYCFVLGIEFGVDINLGIKAQINFEYVYETDITAGVTYVDGQIDSYKSIDTNSSAKDLVMLGKLKAEAGVYVKLTASLLEVVGIGFKVKTGAYAEIAGQLRLDMKAALEDKTLHVIKGYYVTGGLYLAFNFQIKAGIDIPGIGWKGWDKDWELGRLEYPLFEYGSKYLVQSLVNEDMTVEVQGKTAAFNEVEVNAFDLDRVADAKNIKVSLDSFDIEYLDDAADYITLVDGFVKVNPAVGTEFTAVVKITAKNDNYVTGTVSFHKAAVMPTCTDTVASFDKEKPENVTFDVKKNQSNFIALNGNGIDVASYAVADTGAVTIYKEFLEGLAVGEYTFVYVTDKGRVSLTVNVGDSTPISAAVTTRSFLKSAKANVVFALDLSGSKVKEIKGLNAGEYSVDSAGTLVIYASALKDKEPDTYELTVVASNGTELGLNVIVEDDRVPALYENAYTFAKNGACADVTVAYEAYLFTPLGVEGSGLSVGDGRVAVGAKSARISKEFLSGLTAGTHTFSMKFEGATGTEKRNFTINVLANAPIVAGVSVATFDKSAPADVEYTIFTTGSSITLSDNGISKANYTVAGSSVTINAAYLSTLKVGPYSFRATVDGSSVTLSLTVVDNTEPVIESAQGGVLTIEYDKAQSGSRFFEMMLGNATFDKLDGNGVAGQYTVGLNGAKGTTKVTLQESYLNSLRVGTYTYNVLTDVNVSTLIVKVTDTRKPESTTETSLIYKQGAYLPVSVTFMNYEHDVKSIAVKGGTDFSIFDGDGEFDPEIGRLLIGADYLNAQAPNSYVTFMLTFDDAAATVLAVTIAVS
ncbi:MAG: hypothetical protein J5765_03365 [Clostridia bacterium]|nr:hypothetical protein [Clostridia bacterium]